MIGLSKLMSTRKKDMNDLMESSILNNCDLVELKKHVDEVVTYLSYTVQYNYLSWDELLEKRALSLS
ncbi:DUF6036 family nucleotidyltransferase [Psychrobacillus insolitus]|jgi:hypothetical protein|nr:DUF6036 family nucleotidyltransferase [Psychrobacillus insolitus]